VSGWTQDQRLAWLAARLSERDQAIVSDVARLRFLTAGQLSRLHFASIPEPVTRIRRVQRTLARLVEQRLLIRCERRVGGVRAGSASFTYAPAAEGLRLVSYLAGNGIPRTRAVIEPGTSFVDHAVAVNDVYVHLVEAEQAVTIELLQHQAEPDCWRTFLGPIGSAINLRPDAFVALGIEELEQRSFLEVDRGTEGSAALRRKLMAYVDYWRSDIEQQQHGVFPRVIWQVIRPRRMEVLKALIAELPVEARRLFVVADDVSTLACLRGEAAGAGGRP
jgi:hypothetical protein